MAWNDHVRTSIATAVAVGVATVLLAFAGFGTWAAMAPIEGAVIAAGKLVSSGQNKTVQHLEGGIVESILVEEGEEVEAGQVLLVLNGTEADVRLSRLKSQLTRLEVAEARALAERGGEAKITFPPHLVGQSVPAEVTAIVQDQRVEFEARLEQHRAEVAILEQRIAALQEAIAGYETQKREVDQQLSLLAEEREALEELLRQGLTTRGRVLDLKQSEAELRGRKGQLAAAIAQSRETIAEVREEIRQTRGGRLETASEQLNEIRARRADLLEEIRAAGDASDRIVIRAPAAGTVIGLAQYNSGAVITPGEVIMEIVPEDVELLAEARVRPQDINQVHVGQEARLVLSAFPRETPIVPAEVTHVSADRLENDRTGEPYYLVRLKMPPEMPGTIDPAELRPGQPVEVYITTDERTFLNYLAEPISSTLRRSFREF